MVALNLVTFDDGDSVMSKKMVKCNYVLHSITDYKVGHRTLTPPCLVIDSLGIVDVETKLCGFPSTCYPTASLSIFPFPFPPFHFLCIISLSCFSI